MKEMEERLGADAELAAAYRAAHERYLADRAALGDVPEIARRLAPAACPTGSSACTCWPPMRSPPARGVNPLGDEVLDRAGGVVGRGTVCRAGRERPDG